MKGKSKIEGGESHIGSRIYWAMVLILTGFYLLAENYHWFGLHWDLGFEKIWPVVLIVFGFSLIVKFAVTK